MFLKSRKKSGISVILILEDFFLTLDRGRMETFLGINFSMVHQIECVLLRHLCDWKSHYTVHMYMQLSKQIR